VIYVGLRFQRRVRIFPGLRLNLSRSGVGVSIGSRGAHVGITARGQHYASVGLPGTGVSWREYERKPARQCDLCQPGHAHIPASLAALLAILAVVVALALFGRR
jgi:hypothetical protein